MAGVVGKRYGTAIFELAREKDAVETLEDEIILLKATFQELDLEDAFSNPKITQSEKVAIIEGALTGKISHDLMGLLVLIIEKSRHHHFLEIFEEVLELIDEHHGRVKAYIASADELSVDQKNKLVHQLAKQTNKEIIPLYEVEESLIGGLTIRIGDRIVDNSIKGHFHSMSRMLLDTKIEQ